MSETRESGDYRETQEIELKLLLLQSPDHSVFWRIPHLRQGLQSKPVTDMLVSTYYDTPDHDLLQKGYTYRVRREATGWMATVKGMGTVEGGLHRREEWNSPLPEGQPDLTLLEDEKIRSVLMKLTDDQPLVPLMTTRFQRTQALWQHSSGTRIELALDEGVIETETKKMPINELELELKEGSSLVLLELGEHISKYMAVAPGDDSKFHRGLQMLELVPGSQSKEARYQKKALLTKEQAKTSTLAQAVPRVLKEGFADVISSFQNLHHEPEMPEHLHQLRVSLRRLRSLISFLRPALNKTQAEALQTSLQRWSNQWSPLREIDVLAVHFQEFIHAFESADEPKAAPLMQTLVDQQVALARRPLYDSLGKGEMTTRLLACWRQTKELSVDDDMGDRLLADFGEKRLRRWVKRFETKGRCTGLEDIQQLHRLRIQGKKIRYVMESLSPALPDIPRKTVKTMKKLQTLMGDLHDVHCEMKHMKRWVSDHPADVELMRQAGRYEGWQQQRETAFNHQLARFWKKTSTRL
ncbi:CYTH and CHAD domain-containing protein [Anoxynatronum buryatiense]|uniref:Adenylate cyclase n=1 Tax=Anoxynatronum buryatiense TaxID=489973 RepID=A0AA45WY86_9CLOT|nr:CYTH and CHAD domain-containing protein [Anoxynatronum buryatiense]SMP67826.1 adenylate cyclase [Anoxynatronum buryatiense]